MTDDLISRADAMEALLDWELCYTWDEHCKEECESPYIVSPSSVIDKLPSAQQWIPVSERLPIEDEEYLITLKDRHGDTFVKKTMYYPDSELWWDVPSSCIVTAWMPLPKPYGVKE